MIIIFRKGSFAVAKCGAERKIGYDHGVRSCLGEDTYFALFSGQKGLKYGYIEGIMLEQYHETLSEYFNQRQRWLFNLILIALKSPELHWRQKLPIALKTVSWLIMPISNYL